MSQLTDFYFHDGLDVVGRHFYEILGEKNHWLEAGHDWVQWIFPLPEESNFNPAAPLLTKDDVKIFLAKPNSAVEHAMTRFLAFLGIRLDENGLSLTEDYEKQKYTWTQFNHNALRITRFFRFLSLVGYRHSAEQILEFMKDTAAAQDIYLKKTTLGYWHKAVTSDFDNY